MERYRIVVALDQSEYAEIVLEHALDQAARHEQPELHFVTVVANDTHLAETKEQLAELVLEGLDVFRDHGPDWRARLHVRAGKAAEEIVALAEDIGADLIIVGRFGAHRRLGSIARSVLELASCPTLVVNLLDRPVQQPQCLACVQVRAESDGEAFFCARHRAPDRETLATTVLTGGSLTGGTLLW